MITEEGKYYIYRHIRCDKNEPFYIGRGMKGNSHDPYKRAKSNHRNRFWKNIAAKTNYEIEVLVESDNLDFIKQKEIEFTNLYGLRDRGTGTLTNILIGDKFTQTQEDWNIRLEKKLQEALAKFPGFIPSKKFKTYLVNQQGDIINIFTQNSVKPTLTKTGEYLIRVSENCKKSTIKVSRLIAETFIPNPENKTDIINLDYDSTNNIVSNLKWMTREEVSNHYANKYLLETGKTQSFAKLSLNELCEIKLIQSKSMATYPELAKLYKVAEGTIVKIINNKEPYTKLNLPFKKGKIISYLKPQHPQLKEILFIAKHNIISLTELGKIYKIDRKFISKLLKRNNNYVM